MSSPLDTTALVLGKWSETNQNEAQEALSGSDMKSRPALAPGFIHEDKIRRTSL